MQGTVDRAMTMADAELSRRGGLDPAAVFLRWTATNQVTKKARTVVLPRVTVGGVWLGQNKSQQARTPLVDDIRGMTGATVTVSSG